MNIYVGNLNYKVDEDELREMFEEYGQVGNVKIITDKFTGRSKGFGFVEMDDDQEAKRAISELGGSTQGNRQIVVNEARERNSNR